MVVELIKRAKNAVTLAIGDGANDVSMIKGTYFIFMFFFNFINVIKSIKMPVKLSYNGNGSNPPILIIIITRKGGQM